MTLTKSQEKAMKILVDRHFNNETISVLTGFAGTGKALKHGTKIPTPCGYKKIEDLVIGDFVFTHKGKTSKVVAVHPQGEVELYSMKFADGRESICCGEHLWPCYTSKGNIKNYKTSEMFKDYKKQNSGRQSSYHYKYKLIMNEAVEFKSTPLPVDPYIIGAMLGDGCNLQKYLTISSGTDEIPKRIAKILQCNFIKQSHTSHNWVFYRGTKDNGSRNNILTKDFFIKVSQNMMVKSLEKSIPEEYKVSSIKNRYSLIQGLFDTDGSVDQKKGRVRFSSYSKQLAKDVSEVLYSLGISNTLSKQERVREGKKEIEYIVFLLTPPSIKKRMFRLSTKLQRINTYEATHTNYRTYKNNTLRSMQKVGKGLATCITIEDSQGIFLTENYLPTHNSFLLRYLLEYLGYEERQVHFCAYTGVAAKLLMKQGLRASTIHSLIYAPIIRRGVCVGFKKKTRDELEHLKLIVVDEYSMVGQNIVNDLLSFNIPIIFVGDPLQLPAIEQQNDLSTLTHARLTEPMRQALEDPILWAANEVRQGKQLPYGVHGGSIMVGFKTDIDESWIRPDVQILVGTNASRKHYNYLISGTTIPISGNKIMFLKNDWKIGVVNGEIMTATKVQQSWFRSYEISGITESGLELENYSADWEKPSLPKNQFFTQAYAITVHKSQGSTIDQNGLIINESYLFGEDRFKWLYVAISRFATGNKIAIMN